MRRPRSWVVVASAVGLAAMSTMPASASASTVPPPLSKDTTPSDLSSTYGSGDFGQWHADRFGLPAYRYTMDQASDPRAQQVETAGTTTFHQVGNDAHHAFATNDGYVQLWSQARLYQWTNYYQPSSKHYAGGYGYLNLGGGNVLSTLYDDRPAGAVTERDFGVGYFHHSVATPSVAVDEYDYAPFGADPVLLHDVTITNRTSSAQQLSWFEYWDVNPAMQPGLPGYGPRNRGLTAPTYDTATKTLTVGQLPDLGYADPHTADTDPLSIFASALDAPVAGFDTDVNTFFGSGTRAAPAAVAADTSGNSLASPSLGGETHPGNTLMAFRSPITLAPGQSRTLRYAYGTAHPAAIAPLVARWSKASHPLADSEAAWSSWLPRSSFPQAPWLARELEWDAYMVRSRATPEEGCNGYSVLSQGAWYQYDWGFQGAFRDPLEHALPMVYADPALARQVVLYSAHEQTSTTGNIPYAMYAMCSPDQNGESSDLDFWLMLTATEYGAARHDTAFLDEQVPYLDGAPGTLMDHLKLAFWHQEHVIGRGPHGLPLNGATGDWRDFGPVSDQILETTLVGAQLAYVYPRLADLADAHHDSDFAAQLRTAAASLRVALQHEWTGKGWYSRGYAGPHQIGSDVIYGETQPWAILAGIPTAEQRATLVANIRRYLTGIGAAGGPTTIGSALQPAPADGGGASVTEQALGAVPYAWFAIDGSLTWSLGAPDAASRNNAWDELMRNTLANLATVHPDHWNGVISADDVCTVWFTPPPYKCGTSAGSTFDTQNLHQPAWGLFAALKLTGLQPTTTGYRVAPQFPSEQFSLRLPEVGVEQRAGRLRGYVTPATTSVLSMQVQLPAGIDPTTVHAYAAGQAVPSSTSNGVVTFSLPSRAGQHADYAVAWDEPDPPPPPPIWHSPMAATTTSGLPANCTAPAGQRCQFTASTGPVQGYVATVDASTTFVITDPTGAVIVNGQGASANTGEPFKAGTTYTVTVSTGSGEVIAGSPT